jgi:integrase
MEKGINMGQHLRYSKKQQRWRIYYRIVKDGKTIASDEIYAKKKGPALDWPKIPTKKQQEYLRANGYLPSDKDVREMMVRLDNEVASRGSTYETNDKIVVAQLCDMFMDKYKFNDSTNYQKEFSGYIKNFIKPRIGFVRAKNLNISHSASLLDYIYSVKYDHKTKKHIKWQDHPAKKQCSITVLRRVHGTLQKILNFAVEEEQAWISNNPINGKVPAILRTEQAKNYNKTVHDNEVFLKPEEVQLIAKNLKGSEFELPTLLGSVTGMRAGELLGLKWKDWTKEIINGKEQHFLDIKRQVYKCHVRNVWTTERLDGSDKPPKRGSIRKISIGQGAVKILEKQHNYQEVNSAIKGHVKIPKENYIFSNPKNGNVFSRESFSQAFRRAVDRSIKQFESKEVNILVPKESHVHSLRHYHASTSIENEVPLPIISKRLGHKDFAFTVNRYGHLRKGSDIDLALLAEQDFEDYNLD